MSITAPPQRHSSKRRRLPRPDDQMSGVALTVIQPAVSPPRRRVAEPITPPRRPSPPPNTSPQRSLRHVRGSISGPSEECVLANVSPLRSRRNSATLHHPKHLRSSPKSAYLLGEKRNSQMSFEGVAIPQSPVSIDEGVRVVVDEKPGIAWNLPTAPERRPDSPPDSGSDDESENGGAMLEAKKTGKERVLARGGKKVTPWATRANSEAGISQEELAVKVRDEEEELHPEPEQAQQSLQPEQEQPQLDPSPMPKQPEQVLSDSEDEIFEDASERPITSPAPPESVDSSPVDSLRQHYNPNQRHSVRSVSTRDSASQTQDDRVVLVYDPDSTTVTSPTTAPALNLIPATPAEVDKQLGHPPHPSLLSRRATDVPIPEEPQEPPTQQQQRPSLATVPDKVRESKLHPWWRPKRFSVSDADIEEEGGEIQRRHTSAVDGRRGVRIKGTRLVVEFVGWRTIGNALHMTRSKKREGVVLDLDGRPIRRKGKGE